MATLAEQIAAAMDGGATCYGLRADDARYAVGDVLPDSRVWVDGEPTDEMLDGTSAMRLGGKWTPERALRSLDSYLGGYLYLLASDHDALYGEDDGEHIMRRAVVVAVWRREA